MRRWAVQLPHKPMGIQFEKYKTQVFAYMYIYIYIFYFYFEISSRFSSAFQGPSGPPEYSIRPRSPGKGGPRGPSGLRSPRFILKGKSLPLFDAIAAIPGDKGLPYAARKTAAATATKGIAASGASRAETGGRPYRRFPAPGLGSGRRHSSSSAAAAAATTTTAAAAATALVAAATAAAIVAGATGTAATAAVAASQCLLACTNGYIGSSSGCCCCCCSTNSSSNSRISRVFLAVSPCCVHLSLCHAAEDHDS